MSRRARGILAALAVLGAAAGVYWNTLALGFAWDDSWLILDNARIRDPGAYAHYLFLERPLWRPVKRTSLALDYAAWGPERPAGFHLTNLALHAAATLALWAFFRRLGVGQGTATVAALLFAVHPVHVEAVASITHRKESLALLFDVLAFLAYLEARRPQPRAPLAALLRRKRGPDDRLAAGVGTFECLLLAVVAYLLGILSKEVGAILLPATVLAWELLLARPAGPAALPRPGPPAAAPDAGSAPAKPWRPGAFLLACVPILVFLAYRGPLRFLARPFERSKILYASSHQVSTYAGHLVLVLRSLAISAGLLVWPWPLYLDRRFSYDTSLAEPLAIAGLGLIAAYVTALVMTARRLPHAAFALAWMGIHWLPVSNLLPLTYWYVAERFLYVPSAGFALLVAVLFERLWQAAARRPDAAAWRGLLASALAAVLVLLGTLTVRQNRVWKDDLTLWAHTLENHPDSFRALEGYGRALLEAGRREQAEPYLRRAVAVRPEFPDGYLDLGRLLGEEGRLAEAREAAERAVALVPGDPRSWDLAGWLAFQEGRQEAAAESYRKALALDSEHAPARQNLATVLLALGRPEEALGLTEDPRGGPATAEILLVRGRALEALGRGEEAVRSYRSALALDGRSAKALNVTAVALLRRGQRDEARALLERSLTVDPEQPEAQRMLELLRRGP